ncbi:DUF6653 family protein [Halarcobacter ebronensis]|uniref:Uncharacterized protein n=1 Tax=Halarcobacter ebronensis TaxID=1462615 RepID=A0A4V1LZT6_9BACT|nr:DUF6653 family protein [Halarcobacter ebronensis]RXK02123.1 hypothetical protein CRV07_14000 [Halarcobacter ebronensis]
MTFEKKLSKLFQLNDERWMRHANPLSVWTRYSVLPIIILSFWSRYYLGWWSLFFIFISILWMFLNPIIFSKPKSTKNWASKSVLGERIYLNRDNIEIPKHHHTMLYSFLNIISLLGIAICIYAIIYYSFWAALLGISLTYLSKSWFLDRMVWLYEDMKDSNKEFKNWEY